MGFVVENVKFVILISYDCIAILTVFVVVYFILGLFIVIYYFTNLVNAWKQKYNNELSYKTLLRPREET